MSNGQTQLELQMVPSMKSFLRYRDLPYDPWFAIAELVDNSTQSYLDHRERLGPELVVRLDYDGREKTLTVYDEAYGMDEDELRRAVILGDRPPNTKGRCEYGMGMKTSCCWMGRNWSITTKMLGVPYEYYIEIDVDELAKSTGTVFAFSKPAPEDKHYTIIKVWNMFMAFRGRTLGKIKDTLGETYRFDIEEEWLKLLWNGDPLAYQLPSLFTERRPNGDERIWKKDIEFTVNSHKVSGWAGILKKGDFAKSGFNCYRRKRLIKGRWKPVPAFPPKPGHLLHQRLTGELFLDAFNVTHLKDDFKWEEVDPDEFGEKLYREIEEIREKAVKIRHEKPSHVNAAIEMEEARIRAEMESPALVESLEIAERQVVLPAEETPKQRAELLERLRSPEHTPISFTIDYRGETRGTIFFPKEASPNDPYLDVESTPQGEKVDVIINLNHPFAGLFVEDTEMFHLYVRMLTLEGLAEWLLKKEGKEAPTAKEVRLAKDQLLRTSEPDIRLTERNGVRHDLG